MIPEDLQNLIDGYLAGPLSEAEQAELDVRLRADPDARRYFVRYAQLHADLSLLTRASRASDKALRSLEDPPRANSDRGRKRFRLLRWAVAAGFLLLAAGLGWGAARGWPPNPPTLVPRCLDLDFRNPIPGSLNDKAELGTGLTHRLPGTGARLPAPDPNLRLDLAKGHLEITTTESDVNTQFKIETGEYPGVRLADLGFTGDEDFSVTASLPDIPALAFIGQFGLYAGSGSACNIRGGLLGRREAGRYTLFLVNNNGGRDTDAHFLGLFSTGDHLQMILKRTAGKYALTVANRTNGSSSTLTIRHPAFLDDRKDLYVGLFAANPRSEAHRPVRVKDFQVTVLTRTHRRAAP
jgi:hypothetical protein